MNCPQRAVCFLEEDSSIPAHSKPLMLEAVLFCPILTWVGDKLQADGVERFFIVCGPTFAEEVRRCFPADADVIVSEQQKDLMEFLNTPDQVLVLPGRPCLWRRPAWDLFTRLPAMSCRRAGKSG